mgnify:CR=1 FL=1
MTKKKLIQKTQEIAQVAIQINGAQRRGLWPLL